MLQFDITVAGRTPGDDELDPATGADGTAFRVVPQRGCHLEVDTILMVELPGVAGRGVFGQHDADRIALADGN